MSEKKEIVKKEKNELSTEVVYGVADDISQEDCETGRIVIIQATSDLAKDGTFRPGSIINLSEQTEICFKEETPVEFLIVGKVTYWTETDADTRDFISRYPATREGEFPREEVIDGRNIKRMYNFSYLVFLPSEIKEGMPMPHEITFRSTSLKVAKRLNGMLRKMKAKQMSSWGLVFNLTAKISTKGKDSWFVPAVVKGREATKEEEAACLEFYKEFKNAESKFIEGNTNTSNHEEY